MDINDLLNRQGWETVPRQNWVAVKDKRPGFRGAFSTDRVGKIVGTNFYVTLMPLAEVTQGLVQQIGGEPLAIKSTNGERDVMYWGLDTAGVTEDNLRIFVHGLASAIDDLLKFDATRSVA